MTQTRHLPPRLPGEDMAARWHGTEIQDNHPWRPDTPFSAQGRDVVPLGRVQGLPEGGDPRWGCPRPRRRPGPFLSGAWESQAAEPGEAEKQWAGRKRTRRTVTGRMNSATSTPLGKAGRRAAPTPAPGRSPQASVRREPQSFLGRGVSWETALCTPVAASYSRRESRGLTTPLREGSEPSG